MKIEHVILIAMIINYAAWLAIAAVIWTKAVCKQIKREGHKG